jgi:signal transduction histidine kinase
MSPSESFQHTGLASPQARDSQDSYFLPKAHRIIERRFMEFRPFGKTVDGQTIRDMSGVSIRSNVEYLEESVAKLRGRDAGKQIVEDLVELLNARIPDRPYHVNARLLKNPWVSYSNEFTAYLVEFCIDLSGDPEFQFNMGREKLIPPLIQTLMRPFSVGQIYKAAAYYAQHYCKDSYQLEGFDVTERSAILRMTLTDHALRQFGGYRRSCGRIWCNALRAGISIVPEKVHHLAPATVTHRRCIVEGDEYCEWNVNWPAAGRWYPGKHAVVFVGKRILHKEIQERDQVIQEQMRSLENRHDDLEKAYVELQQSTVELQKRVDHLTTLHAAGLIFTGTRKQEELLQHALQILIHKLNYDRVLMTFFDPQRQVTYGGRLFGVASNVADFARGIEVPITDPSSIEGTVIMRGNPILILDTSEIMHRLHPLNRELIRLTGSESFISVPLKVNDRVLGSLTVDRAKKPALTEEDLALMVTFGNQIAIALDNAAAYREIENLNVHLEEKIQERTTQLKAVNEQLKEMDRLKSQFLAHVSHELRTPLTSITGFTDNMLDGLAGPLTERQEQYLARIKANGNRLCRMISNLLDLSKIEAGKLELCFEETHLPNLVSEVIEQLRPLAEGKHQRLQLLSLEEPLTVWADPDRFSQILINLVENAIKYTPEAGSITVRLIQEGRRFISILVTDTGPGISREALPKLFDPFFRASHHAQSRIKGLGLGLSIVKELVELHGGAITVHSDEGKGTEFVLKVPLGHALNKPRRPLEINTRCILVADDDPDMRQLLRDRLESEGFAVETARDGHEAMEAVRRGGIDGLILDIGMPEIDGVEVLRRVRETPSTIPVVMITAESAQERALSAMKAGAQAYLLKPFDGAQFHAVVDRYFHVREN